MLTWIDGMLRRYLNSFYKKNFTARFIELWKKTSWTFDEYFYCHNEYYNGHESRVAKQTFVMVLSLIAAVISFFTEVFFLCFLFALIALRAYLKSSQHKIILEMMQANLMLARLQNNSDESKKSRSDLPA